jgi:hypothetical protein
MSTHTLKFYNHKKAMSDATLVVETEPDRFVQLFADGFDSGKINGEKIYPLLQKLHVQLDALDAKLLCNAFRFDVRPSGMALSMGDGLRAYKMELGVQATELVNVLDPTDDLSAIASFDEQNIFFEKWIGSLGKH